MERKISLFIDAKLLATNEDALKHIVRLFSELEEKGFLKESRIVFDSTQDDEIKEILDRHIAPSFYSNPEIQ